MKNSAHVMLRYFGGKMLDHVILLLHLIILYSFVWLL